MGAQWVLLEETLLVDGKLSALKLRSRIAVILKITIFTLYTLQIISGFRQNFHLCCSHNTLQALSFIELMLVITFF
jgi:hypothetical protein